ncbi:putative MFS multidrug transporter [Aureobasidium sp. EXF-10727]|nr:putative MFS multidrug transporter [Aureobasidium sp. EXF-10727]
MLESTSQTPTHSACETPLEESLQERVERLGRERPPVFASTWDEIDFVFSIAMSQFLTEYFVSGFVVILPTLIRELNIPQALSVWPATAFSLVIASTLLIFGRLGDMWDGHRVFLSGLTWLIVWSIIAGFSINPLMLDLCRALQGFGPAAFLPTGVQLLGSLYRPGPRKNLVFAIYGASAIFGFFGGILIAGIVGQFLRWGFYFWIGGIIATVTLLSSLYFTPKSPKAPKSNVRMDYEGALYITSGLVLVIFAITQSAHAAAGWKTPYILVCFIFGLVSLLVAAYVEVWTAEYPLLPSSIFTTPCMTPLLAGLFLLYGAWGIFSVYGTLYFQNIMSASAIEVVAWYTPLGVAGLLISVLEGYILHLVPGRILLIISGLGAVGAQLLLALIPLSGANYWAWIFPAMILSTIGIDLSTILMTVFVTSSFPAAEQGLVGGLINSVLQLGVAFTLGLADIIQSRTVESEGLGESYKKTFWLGVGVTAIGLVVMAIWGKVPRASSDLTADEKEELRREAEAEELRAQAS